MLFDLICTFVTFGLGFMAGGLIFMTARKGEE